MLKKEQFGLTLARSRSNFVNAHGPATNEEIFRNSFGAKVERTR